MTTPRRRSNPARPAPNPLQNKARAPAGRSARPAVARARTSLQRQAVELAVELAEQTLRGQVSQDDQRRLARDLLNSLSDSEVKADA